jgi:predicted RNA-binding Zn-ribbon protein involved in translation (DUF1610 family)
MLLEKIMDSRDNIFDQRTFDRKMFDCPKCGWHGTGGQANIADFYGIGKFQEVLCPKCGEHLGNLSKEHSYGEGGSKLDSQIGPG